MTVFESSKQISQRLGYIDRNINVAFGLTSYSNEFIVNMKPIFIVGRAFGCFPVTFRGNRSVFFKLLSCTFLYCMMVYLGIITFCIRGLYVYVMGKGLFFAYKSWALLYFVYTFFGIQPLEVFLWWISSSMLSSYAEQWWDFQECYRQITRCNLQLRLHRFVRISLLFLAIINCIGAIVIAIFDNSLESCVINLVPFVLSSLSDLLFSSICMCVTRAFRLLNRFSDTLLTGPTNSLWASDVMNLRILYVKLIDLAAQSGSLISYRCLAQMILFMSCVTVFAYYLLDEYMKGDYELAGYISLLFIMFIGVLVADTVVPHMATDEVSKAVFSSYFTCIGI